MDNGDRDSNLWTRLRMIWALRGSPFSWLCRDWDLTRIVARMGLVEAKNSAGKTVIIVNKHTVGELQGDIGAQLPIPRNCGLCIADRKASLLLGGAAIRVICDGLLDTLDNLI